MANLTAPLLNSTEFELHCSGTVITLTLWWCRRITVVC